MGLYSENLVVDILGITIAIACVVYAYMKYVAYNYWSSKNIPFVKPVVPFGSLLPVFLGKRSMGQLFRDSYMKFKKSRVFGVYTFHKPTLVINDPELIRFIFTKEFAHFHSRGLYSNEKIDPLTGNLFLLSGDRWKYLRAKFTPTFTSSKLKKMYFTIKENSEKMAKYIEPMATNSEVVEIRDIIARYGTDTIASTAFGIECNSLENPDNEFRKWGRKFFEPQPVRNTFGFLAPRILELLKIRFLTPDVADFFLNAFKKTVEYRIANNVVRNDFLDLTRQLMTQGYVQGDEKSSEVDTRRITMNEGAAQAFVFWLGGFETSSTVVSHTLYELALNPDIQDRLADEITTVLEESGDMTYESIKQMRYLEQVVSETMRKYPPVPVLNRECTADIDLPGTGFHVTKGTPIVIPVYGIQTDPDIYPDPDKFDPERFTPENVASRHQYTYLPFGEGPRICIGMRFGWVQTKVALASLLSRYRFSPGPNLQVPMRIDPGAIVTGTVDGIDLRIERR